jgi:ribosomal protein L37AE/L43A
MTLEHKSFISINDVRAFQITCSKCLTCVSIPAKECYYKTAWQCPQCQTPFFHGGAAQNEAIISLAKALHDIQEQINSMSFGFRIEIATENEEVKIEKSKI